MSTECSSERGPNWGVGGVNKITRRSNLFKSQDNCTTGMLEFPGSWRVVGGAKVKRVK